MRTRPTRWFLSLTALVLLAGPAPAKSLDEEVGRVADDIRSILKRAGVSGIALGRVEEVSVKPLTNGGPGMMAALREALELRSVTVNDEAPVLIKGEYSAFFDREPTPAQFRVAMNLRLLDRRGKTIVDLAADLEISVDENPDIARLLGITAPLSPNGDAGKRNEEIHDAHKSPAFFADGTVVRAKTGSEYGVEVLVGTGDSAKPRAVEDLNGRAFVDVRRGESYQLRLYNYTGQAAGVTIAIDGIDVFHISEDRDPESKKPLFTHFIVPANGSTVIKGWHVTNDPNRDDNMREFLVTDYGKGLASKLGRTTGVGVITVTFSAAYPTEEEKLRAEPNARNVRETIPGKPIKEDLEAVEAHFGVVREVVSVRYDR